jgi:hypothetical protein
MIGFYCCNDYGKNKEGEKRGDEMRDYIQFLLLLSILHYLSYCNYFVCNTNLLFSTVSVFANQIQTLTVRTINK